MFAIAWATGCIQPEAEAAPFRLTAFLAEAACSQYPSSPSYREALNSARLKQGNLDLVPQEQQETHRERLIHAAAIPHGWASVWDAARLAIGGSGCAGHLTLSAQQAT